MQHKNHTRYPIPALFVSLVGTTLILLCGVGAGWAQGPDPASPLATHISLRVRDTPVAIALAQLHRASGVPISFSPTMLPEDLHVSCPCADTTVAAALDHLLADTGFKYVEVQNQIVIRKESQPDRGTAPPAASGAVAGRADVSTGGRIFGSAKSADGIPLPGALITLRGEGLIQQSLNATTGPTGAFRFLSLVPGSYSLTIKRDTFQTIEYTVQVLVGKTATIDAVLEPAPFAEEIAVTAEAPLFDKTSASHGTNFTQAELISLPATRDFIDTVDAAAGFHNRSAYGAGGNVDGYDTFGAGAASNAYNLNGVGVSNLEFGNTWVNPNYDSIDEIQIVGPGGGAEHANYSGAVVNVVTKSGTNDYKGSAALFYTDDGLTGDNSEGIVDLEQGKIDELFQYSATLGGPIVRERLLFFASAGLTDSATASPGTELYDDLRREQYQLRLDYSVNNHHTLSAMANHEPIQDDDLGLQEQAGPEIGYYREQRTTAGNLNWTGVWGNNTLSELRYASVDGYHGRIPNAALDVISVNDQRTGRVYNSVGFQREQENERQEARGALTHYVDDFLGASHELKVGLEYEEAETLTDFISGGNALLFILPLGPVNYLAATVNYNLHQNNALRREAAFIQDRATFGRATLSLGVRFDSPETEDANTGKSLLSFDQVSPRLGLVYDFTGDGKNIGRLALGRYYDKVPTYGVGTYAGTGIDEVLFYGLVTAEPLDPADWQSLYDLLIRPENIRNVFASESSPVEAGIGGPKTDVVNLGFDRQLGDHYALSFNYIYRESDDYIVLTQFANDVTYEPFTYHSDFTGRDLTIYAVTGGGPREFALGNRDFNYQETHMFIAELRARPTEEWFVDASIALERSRGTCDNNECAILSLCSNGVDENPNWERNSLFTDAALSQERPWNVKLRTSYTFPSGLTAAADMRWFSGRSYGAVDRNVNIPGANDPYYVLVLLEPKDARDEPDGLLLNLRLAQDFRVGPTTATVSVDVLNATNADIDPNTNIRNGVSDVYPLESGERGELVSAFGQPFSLAPPRQYRLGVRVTF